jgi:hypothetical protein
MSIIKNKKYFTIILLLLLIFGAGSDVLAGKRYWVGTGANKNWNSTGNWSATSGGTSGATVPGSNDTAYFNNGGIGQCSVNATVNIRRLEMVSGFTDTLKQNANTITIGTGGMVLNAGVFKGGSASITNSGIFTLNGCNFISTTDILSISGNYTFSSGTFTHNNGQVWYRATSTINGSTTFYDLNFAPTGNSSYAIESATTLTVYNELKTSGSARVTLNTGTIIAKGDILIGNTYTTSAADAGTATIIINDTADQTFSGNASIGLGRLCNIKIDKTSGTLILKDFININGDLDYVQGTIDGSTYASELVFCNSDGRTISGKPTFGNLTFYAPYTNITTISDTVTVTGTLKTSGNIALIVSSGIINLKGNLTIANTSTSNSNTCNATIMFSGNGNQLITGTTNNLEGRLCNVKINKSGGTLTLKNTITMGMNKDWNYIQGTLDVSTYDSKLVFAGGTATDIEGTQTLKNVTFTSDGSTTTFNMDSNDTLTVTGELRYEGTVSSNLNTGNIHAKGDITITNTSVANLVPTSKIKICGTGDQTITGTTVPYQGRLCSVEINKPSGTLILKNAVTIASNCSWKLINGTLDATTYSSTIAFTRNTVAIEGNQTFYNLNFSTTSTTNANYNIPSSDTITVLGELKTEGDYAIGINNGTIKAKGDITLTNTYAGSHATNNGTISICGSGTQTFTGSGVSTTGKICNIKIDKASGTLNLSSIINMDHNWDYVKGNVNAGTSTCVFNGGSSPFVNTVGMSSSMSFCNFASYSSVILNSNITCTGNVKINTSSTLNGNSKSISLGGNWDNSGTFTYAGTDVIFNGSGRQRTIKASGTENFHNLTINKPSQNLLLGSPVTINNNLQLTKGIIGASSTNYINILNDKTSSAGSDSSYVCGPMKKTGNDAFTFALGDTLLTTGAYHPLVITAPTATTDAFTAQYFSTNQTYGSTLQTDSLSSISNCENWLLTRNAGTSVVIPSLGWNSNSCNVDLCHKMRVAGWNGSQWNSMGITSLTPSGNTGVIKAASGISASSLPLVISRTVNSSLYPPVMVSTSNDTICLGSAAILTAAGATTYSWSPSTGLSATTGDSVIASPNTTTTYSVIGTNGFGCSDTAVISITVLSLPNVMVSASPDTSICLDSSLVLTASGATTYSWYPTTGLDSIAGPIVPAWPSSDITYSVIGADSLGCIDTASISITVHPVPVVSVTPNDTTMGQCFGPGLLIASGATTYQWSPSIGLSDSTGTSVLADPISSITYTVTGTTSFGCMNSATSSIEIAGNGGSIPIGIGFSGFSCLSAPLCFLKQNPEQPQICEYVGTICTDSTITLQAYSCSNYPYALYTWNMGDGTILTGSTISHIYNSALSSNIVLTVTDPTGHWDSVMQTIPITVVSCWSHCSEPNLYVSDTTYGLDTIINLTVDSTIFICGNSTYNFYSNCYHPYSNESSPGPITYVSWILSDTDPETLDTMYTGGEFSINITSGTYTLTMINFGCQSCEYGHCDSSTFEITIQSMNCEQQCSDCLGSFSPIPGKKYLLSAWVKEEDALLTKTSYSYPQIVISSPSVSFASSAFTPSGRIIDGWQRIEKEFILPSTATDIQIELKCTTGDCFFDDIRVFPFDGSLKSYVYDPISMKLSAELDERNYATFYEYDEEGKLVRVKKETEKGIMTIKENRDKTKK